MKKEDNLRGEKIRFAVDGTPMTGFVVTHIKDDRWLVFSNRRLPKNRRQANNAYRLILHRHEFELR